MDLTFIGFKNPGGVLLHPAVRPSENDATCPAFILGFSIIV